MKKAYTEIFMLPSLLLRVIGMPSDYCS